MAAASRWGGGGHGIDRARDRPCRFAHGIGERDKIVGGRRWWFEFAVVADKLPAPGRGQAHGVRFAQVIGVRLGVHREGAHHGRGLRIDIGQRSNRLPLAAVAGATSWRPHGV